MAHLDRNEYRGVRNGPNPLPCKVLPAENDFRFCFSFPKTASAARRYSVIAARVEEWLYYGAVLRLSKSMRGTTISPELETEGTMRTDRVEVSWDVHKSKWLIRIETGEEVLRRHCDIPKDADEQTLRSAAQKTVEDEGYEPDPTHISIRR